jgi:hypothetical protein
MKRLCSAALLLLCGCATITEGSDQSVTVMTDPSGAQCELRREGSIIGVVNPTPGTVQIDKDKDTITISCELEGYERGMGTLDSEFEGMTAGNLLFGGIIGVGVDAASGAMHEYPSTFTLILDEILEEELEEPAADDDATAEERYEETPALY